MESEQRKLFLAAGLPGSGTTLLSWCFLQRSDTDGVLDAAHDVLPEMPAVKAPNLWCKSTISAFRMVEMIDHFTDQGFAVQPILMVRDVRAVFNAMLVKKRTPNGTTAEEPPIRLRLRRFLQDWNALRERAVVIRYESLVQEPDFALRNACDKLGLEWSGDMLAWPKPADQIADLSNGSPSFHQTRGLSFIAAVDPAQAEVMAHRVPREDLQWLDSEFAEYNRANGYVDHLPRSACRATKFGRAEPSFTNTERYRRQKALGRLIGSGLGSISQAMRRNPVLRSFSPSPKPQKSQENYVGYATLFAD